jgi:Carboxypeptidase regulatory-like domain
MRRAVLCLALLSAAVFLVPATSSAQAAITGVVRDTSGAVIPGVLVEASSPALIERTRSVVTDSSGQYRIVDLSPGIYDVAFTLAGFKSVRRGNIVLEGNFTPTVNAELQVGLLEEILTITAESPIVDVVNTTTAFVANRDVLDTIPVAIRNTPARALLIPGTTVTPFVLGQYNMRVHGSDTSDMVIAIDGMRVNNLCGSGQFSGFYMNDASVQEVSYTTGAESAEMQAGGLRINSIPKDGGNTFSGSFFAYGQGSSLQADNRSDAVKAAGVLIAGTAYDYQFNPSFGGPLKKDKLWFYFTYKYQNAKVYVPSSKFADGSQAFRNLMGNYSAVTRLTWAASSKDKLRFYIEKQFNGEFYNGFNTLPTTSPEASTDAFGDGWVPQLKWTRAHSNRLLLDAGISYYTQGYEQNYREGLSPLAVGRLETTTNRLTGAAGFTIPPYTSWTHNYSSAASASYVTGTHAIKTGMTLQFGTNSRTFTSHGEINSLLFALGSPVGVAVANTPAEAQQKVKRDLGLYVQDAWTRKRLTFNYGARFDSFNAEVPAQSAAAGPWIQARNFPVIKNVPNWNDWSVRLAGAYDLFGTGKTALKLNAGKYVASQAAGFAANFNGMTYSTQNRAWLDLDRNGSVLDGAGNIQFNEVFGGTSNFGQITSRSDPDLLRGYNWEYSASVQHELVPRLSITAGYYRRNFYNLQVIDNQNVAASEWNQYTIPTPTDTRLPTSGQPITMYNLNGNKVGTATDSLYTFSTANHTTYNGFEVSANARFSKLLMFGGVTTDRRATTSCDGNTATNGLPNVTSGTSARDNPNALRFCDVIPPFRTTFKLSGAYSLPYEFQLSGTFLAVPGEAINANYTVTSVIAGRTVIASTAGAATLNVNLIQPNSTFLDYKNQMDLRLGKTFRVSRTRTQAFMDIFNVLNAGTVTRVNETYGSSPATNAWMTPLQILDGRFVRFGVQLTF